MNKTASAAVIFLAAFSPAPLLAEMPSIIPMDIQPITQVSPEIRGTWRVIEIRDGQSENLIAIAPNEPEMTISFEDGTFGLSAGCNGIGGDIFARDGEHHVVGDMFSTMMLCPEDQDQQERRLWRAFPEDGYHHRVANHLHLFGENGQLMLTLVVN
jgi:heat shock protein HslJ